MTTSGGVKYLPSRAPSVGTFHRKDRRQDQSRSYVKLLLQRIQNCPCGAIYLCYPWCGEGLSVRPLRPIHLVSVPCKMKKKYDTFISNDAYIHNWSNGSRHHTSQSRGCRIRFMRPPQSTWVTWATVPFRRPENPSWRPCPRPNRTRCHRDSSCRAGPSIGPCPSASQDRPSSL